MDEDLVDTACKRVLSRACLKVGLYFSVKLYRVC